MITNPSEKAFLIITTILILISGNIVLVAAQTEKPNNILKVGFAPSKIEQTESDYKIGYVWFENKAGNIITTPKDITVTLKSDNSEIASIPSQIIVPSDQEYSTFSVNTHGIKGQVTISASYNDQTAFDILTIGDQDFTDNNLRLVINLPISEMNVNTQMPFSFYLINYDGQITQAPFDIPISIDYEKSLINVNATELIIKKGNSYVLGTISTKDKVGNAFLRATSDALGFDEAKEIKISSSLPASLSVNIFPEKTPATLKRDIDIIVTLVDSDGLPTLAQDDVKLEFFSDDQSVNNQIDRKIKEESIKGTIKKGEFSYRFTPRLDFSKEGQTISIGASTKGLGIATDTFETVRSITSGNPLAENKTLQIFTLGKIPTKSQSVVVYQLGAMIEKETNSTDTTNQTVDQVTDAETTTEREFVPIIVNENYDSTGSEQKINIITSNDLLLRVREPGKITAASSYGTAIVETGQETGQVSLSSTIKGIGSASTITEVINTLKQEKTMLFSPTGTNAVLFDKNGRFDFFVVSLDFKGRPTIVENEIRYLITPINEIVIIEKGKTFAHVNFQGDSIQSENEDTIPIKTIPIGESADVDLEVSNNYAKNPTAKLVIDTPQKQLNANHDYTGTVQIVDFNDNPIILGEDLRIKLTTSGLGTVKIPDSVTITAGTSHTEFTISTIKDGETKITADGRGIVKAESDIMVKTLVTKLKISVGSVVEPVMLDQPTQMKIYVDDDYENSIGGAKIKIISADSSISSSDVITSNDGSATIQFNAQKAPKTSLQILASAEGYSADSKTVEFAVSEAVEAKKTELPDWVIYGAIAGVIAIGGGIFAFLRDPKKRKNQEDEDEIYD